MNDEFTVSMNDFLKAMRFDEELSNRIAKKLADAYADKIDRDIMEQLVSTRKVEVTSFSINALQAMIELMNEQKCKLRRIYVGEWLMKEIKKNFPEIENPIPRMTADGYKSEPRNPISIFFCGCEIIERKRLFPEGGDILGTLELKDKGKTIYKLINKEKKR